MNYIKENFIRKYLDDPKYEENAKKLLLFESWQDSKKIFLSHSHLDKELAKGLKNYLYSLNINLYIDWLDSSMPPNTNKETAEKIKKKIIECDHFMLLATNNAIKSRWVPWELGIADIAKTSNNISLIPIVNENEVFLGSEYLTLYNYICDLPSEIIVLQPNSIYYYKIKDWLTK
ncbi:MAG: toll/interleukin-1 receptor domain-containing protein [bacterium]